MFHTVLRSAIAVIAFTSISSGIWPAVHAQPRVSEIGGRLGTSESGSGYLDLKNPMSFRAGDELRVLVGGTAKKVVIRLLAKGGKPDSAVGIVGGPLDVPSTRLVRVVLTAARDDVVQISVHGGENPWNQISLGSGNGPATLLRVERVSP